MAKLFCGQDPYALGIENESAAWDLSKLEAHIRECDVCRRATEGLKMTISDAQWEAIEPTLRRVNRMAEVRLEDLMILLAALVVLGWVVFGPFGYDTDLEEDGYFQTLRE